MRDRDLSTMLNLFRAKRAAAGLGDPTSPGRSAVSAGRSGENGPPVDEDEDDEDEDEDETEAEDEDLDEAEDGDDEENEASGEDEDDGEEEAPPAKKAKAGKAASGDGARIQAILTSPEGRANPSLAEAFAFDSKLSAAKAIKFLGASKPAGAGKRQSLGAALAAEGADRPRVGMGGSRAEAKSAEDEQIAAIVKAAASAGMTRKSA